VNIKTAEIRHEGGMRFVATTGSGHSIVFDDRADDTGPGPTETIAAALGACTAMDVASIALKKRQDVTSYAIHVRAEQRDEYPRVFTSVDIVHEIEGPDVSEAASSSRPSSTARSPRCSRRATRRSITSTSSGAPASSRSRPRARSSPPVRTPGPTPSVADRSLILLGGAAALAIA